MPSTGELGRTPPQDLAAEQSVLGGMLLSKDAIADVVEVVRGHDFYRPAHELVYEAVLDLYGRGEPADAVTVSAELQKRGELGRVGGAPYLHTLLQSVPTAANAGYYARIVRETAILRRLIEAGTKIVQLGYTGDGDADDIVDAAQAEVYDVTDRRTSEDYLPLSAIMEGALDEIEAIGSRGGEMVGVPTGFADFDELTNGLHPGQMIVARRPAGGRQGARARHRPGHAHGLDDDGRGRGRRPADRGRRPADDGGGGHRGHDRPALLRGRVRRRHGHRRRRRARLADRDGAWPARRSGPPARSPRRCGPSAGRRAAAQPPGAARTAPLQLADADVAVDAVRPGVAAGASSPGRQPRPTQELVMRVGGVPTGDVTGRRSSCTGRAVGCRSRCCAARRASGATCWPGCSTGPARSRPRGCVQLPALPVRPGR